MIGKRFIKKLRNLAEIALLPKGLQLKLQHQSFDWQSYRLSLRIKALGVAPAFILDVGANEGQFAIGASTTFPKAQIISYEPGTNAFARLKQTLKNYPNIKLLNKALGSDPGHAVLHVTNADQSSSLLELGRGHLLAYPEIREVAQETVEVTTIQKELKHMMPPEPILLKIDTQGFEMQVLHGASHALKSLRWILLETTTQPMYRGEFVFNQIASWLQEREFAFLGPVDLHISPTEKPGQFDALFEHKALKK